MADYEYPPVRLPDNNGNNFIRVLQILPGRLTSEIRLLLRLKDLRDKTKYEALSYTWGARTEGCSVLVNKTYRLPVTDNLYVALQRLRRWHRRRTIWIDALCINQLDNQERAAQVAIMGHIYKNATFVNIWLGEPERAFGMSLESMRNALTALKFAWDHILWRRPEEWPPGPSPLAIFLSLVPKVARSEHQTLDETVWSSQPPWMERAWVIQEFMMACRIRVLFGAHTWTFDQLLLSDVVLQAFPENRNLRFIGDAEDLFYVNLRKLRGRLCRSNDDEWISGPFDCERIRRAGLVHRVNLIKGASTTDPRDLVYSILGLVDDREVRLIDIDYDLPLCKVWSQATYVSIKAHGDHRILRGVMVSDEARNVHLPSWAFDFSSDEAVGRVEVEATHYFVMGTFQPRQSSDFEEVQLDLDTNTLALTGVKFGTIIGSCTLQQPRIAGDLLMWICQEIVQRAGNDAFRNPSLSLSRAIEVSNTAAREYDPEWSWYWHTANRTLGRHTSKNRVHRSAGQVLLGWHHLAHALISYDLSVVAEMMQQYVQNDLPSLVGDDAEDETGTVTCEDMSLFVLDNGLIGLAPGTVAKRDVVVATPCKEIGTSPFLVLRQGTNSLYTFRGLAYVQGCMHPEFWEDWDALDALGETFLIA